jgi:molecular chaperone GrpE
MSTEQRKPPAADVGARAGADPVSDHVNEAIEQHQPSLDELSVELEQARAKAEEHWDQLLRSRAELENLRRRQAAELEKAHKFALDGFVRELLQVQDSLELGYSAARDPAADLNKLREGTALTLKLLADVMTKFGVEPVDPMGEPFNPEFHQAMSMQPSAEVPPNTVVAVVQKGYTLNGRLVRPALVMVSSAG